jgi:hypothetical protein
MQFSSLVSLLRVCVNGHLIESHSSEKVLLLTILNILQIIAFFCCGNGSGRSIGSDSDGGGGSSSSSSSSSNSNIIFFI